MIKFFKALLGNPVRFLHLNKYFARCPDESICMKFVHSASEWSLFYTWNQQSTRFRADALLGTLYFGNSERYWGIIQVLHWGFWCMVYWFWFVNGWLSLFIIAYFSTWFETDTVFWFTSISL